MVPSICTGYQGQGWTLDEVATRRIVSKTILPIVAIGSAGARRTQSTSRECSARMRAVTVQVLLVQGAGSDGAHADDEPLARSLRSELGSLYEVRYPVMPGQAEPDYEEWKAAILEHVRVMGHGAMLVGHSIGASVLMKMWTDGEARPGIGGLFLVSSPFWHDHHFWRWAEVRLPDDAGARVPAGLPIYLYHGVADPFVPIDHFERIARLFPQAVTRRLPGRDHQVNGDMSEVARDIHDRLRLAPNATEEKA